METVEQFGVFEQTIRISNTGRNAYLADLGASVTGPDGTKVQLCLFWSGGSSFTFRFSPGLEGMWQWEVPDAAEPHSGRFEVIPSGCPGGIIEMPGFPAHFARQDGSPFWFVGDTAWSLVTDNQNEMHDREAAFAYIDKRASQGFNVFHTMCISEAGWGNSGGDAFDDLPQERINPSYWNEVDARIRYANANGATVGLVLAWADKGRNPNSWRAFPSQEARLRYARYIAARYGAYDVYFIVAGEWNADTRRDLDLSEDQIRDQYREIGRAVRRSDPHGRLVGIHPTFIGTTREFAADDWCGFGDYQQMYPNLHDEILKSRTSGKPVVNSEYAYYRRDQDEDGVCDKQNSASLDEIRHATWDILMAGAYVISGFGSTYFGGHRHPGPFCLDDPANADFEEQIQHAIRFFSRRKWWELEPADGRITSAFPRGSDEVRTFTRGGRERTHPSPPLTTYWALASLNRIVAYVRGLSGEVNIDTGSLRVRTARQYNPRSGEWSSLTPETEAFTYGPPDSSDWVVLLES